MVLRKPYAFLIKFFKPIHAILALFMLILLYRSYEVYQFYNEYYKEGLFNSIEGISSKYITIGMFLSIFVIIAISLTILLLMHFKKKPIKYYFISQVLYIVLIFLFIFIRVQLKQIEWNEIDIKIVKITRDISLVTFLIQIPFVIVSIVRAVGFNIKKFNFEKDLKELQIDDIDNEEFEVGVSLDQNDIRTILRRRLRIIRYTLKENKYILLSLFGIIMILTGAMIYADEQINHKVYKENEILNTSFFQIGVTDSYQLDTNTSNNDITQNAYSYTVVKIKVKNRSANDLKMDVTNFRLRTGQFQNYEVDTSYYKSFIEFGTGYKNQTIKSKETKDYILVFKIKKEEKTNDKQLEYLTGAKRKGGELIFNYAKFALTPKTFDKSKTVQEVALGKQITFKDSLLKNTSLTIKKVEFQNSFVDKTQKCINKKCYDMNTHIVPTSRSKYQKIVMKVEYELILDEGISSDIKDDFFGSFANLKYTVDKKNYTHGINLVNITPQSNNNYAYLEVKEELKNATNIFLDIKIRDKVYTYIVK